ncbi:MAG: hypothetical protein O7C74_09315 [Acidobacteria bacterium]|nr:hypothetical protein [Acidobacteriota bacterium]
MFITLARKPLLLALLLAVLIPPVLAGQDPTGSEAPEADRTAKQVATVGTVLSHLAHALDPDTPATIPPAEALTLLRANGLALAGEVDLTAPLTAVQAARLAAAAGLRLRSDSDNPEAPLPATMVSPLVEILHLALTGSSQP